MVSGYSMEFSFDGGRRGRRRFPKAVVLTAPSRERSLAVKGAKLFNLLPESLRGMNSEHVDFFKNHLDVFLSSIPDQQTHAGLGRAAETNSLLHQIPLFYAMT